MGKAISFDIVHVQTFQCILSQSKTVTIAALAIASSSLSFFLACKPENFFVQHAITLRN
jgi:hypothetical protein